MGKEPRIGTRVVRMARSLPAGEGRPVAPPLVQSVAFDYGSAATQGAVFAGDSGNDLDVLLGPLQAVLVANADAEVRAAMLPPVFGSLLLAYRAAGIELPPGTIGSWTKSTE